MDHNILTWLQNCTYIRWFASCRTAFLQWVHVCMHFCASTVKSSYCNIIFKKFNESVNVVLCQDVSSELYGPLMLTLSLVAVLLYGMKTSGHEVVSLLWQNSTIRLWMQSISGSVSFLHSCVTQVLPIFPEECPLSVIIMWAESTYTIPPSVSGRWDCQWLWLCSGFIA